MVGTRHALCGGMIDLQHADHQHDLVRRIQHEQPHVTGVGVCLGSREAVAYFIKTARPQWRCEVSDTDPLVVYVTWMHDD